MKKLKDRYVLATGYPCTNGSPSAISMARCVEGGEDIALESKAPAEVWDGPTKFRLVLERVVPLFPQGGKVK